MLVPLVWPSSPSLFLDSGCDRIVFLAAVQVAVRIRPLLPKDRAEGSRDCLKLSPLEPIVTIGDSRTFTFDHVVPSTKPQVISAGPMPPSGARTVNTEHCTLNLVTHCV